MLITLGLTCICWNDISVLKQACVLVNTLLAMLSKQQNEVVQAQLLCC